MKGKLSRMWRSGLSLMLALCMMVSLTPAAFAVDDGSAGEGTSDAIKYVSLGDSMANGYGLDGYGYDNWGYNSKANAYPNMVAEKYDWELTQLAMSGFRAREVYYLLSGGSIYSDDYCNFHIKDRCEDNGGELKVMEEYQTYVNNADVISIGLGTNNFGTFFTSRLYSYMQGKDPDYECDLNALLNTVDEDLASQAVAYKSQIINKMNEVLTSQGVTDPTLVKICNDMADAAIYTVADFVISYKGILDYIAENNSNAEVIVVGMTNAMEDMYLTMDGDTVDLSEFYGYIVSAANAYMYSLPAAYEVCSEMDNESNYNLNVYYAPAGSVQQLAKTWTTENIKNSESRDRFVESINKMPFDLIKDAVKDFKLVPVNLANITEYEKNEVDYLTSNINDTDTFASVALYKAFETASITAAQDTSLDATALAALPGALNGESDIFGSVMNDVETYVKNHSQEVIKDAAQIVASGMNMTSDAILDIYQNSSSDYHSIVKGRVDGLVTLLLLEDAMTSALLNNATLRSLMNLFARYIVGEGMGCHPSEEGHSVIAASVCNAYETNHTAKDEVIEQTKIALTELYKLMETYGPEVGAQVWEALEEAGYVEYINTSIDELETALTERYNNYKDVVIPAINASIEELNTQAESLKSELAALQTELAAKKAELEGATGVAAEELADAVAKLEATIASVESAIAAVENNIGDLKTMAEELTAAVTGLEANLADLSGAAADLGTAVETLFAVLEDSDGSSIDSIVSAYDAARDAVLAAAEVLENAVDAADIMINDIGEMAAILNEKVVGLYEMVMADLEEAYNNLTPEQQAAIAEAIAAINAALEEAKALVKAELEKALAELEAEYGPMIEAKKQELAALKAQIEAEIAAKYEEVKAEVEAKIAELNTQAEALKAQLAEKKAELEQLYADLENASEEVKAEIEAKIAELEALVAEIEAKIAVLEGDIAALVDELEAALESIRAEVEAKYEETVAALETAIAELEKAYKEAVDALVAAADEKIKELVAEAEKKLAELGEAGEAVSAIIADIYKQVQDEISAVNNAIGDILTGSVDAVEDLIESVEALGGEAYEAIVKEINELIEAVENAFEEATTADMVIDDDFKYVAIGDGSAAEEGYAEKLAAALNAEAAENGVDAIDFANYAKAGNTVAAERANLSNVADADLITVGFSNVEFLDKAVDNAFDGEELDWSLVVGNENVPYVEQLMAEVATKIAEAGIEGEYADMANAAVEAYAYAAVQYAVELPELINDIRAVNSDAVVIVVGQYNPMNGVSIVVDNVTLDIGEYVDYLIDGVAAHGTAYALLTGNAIYVDARNVDTVNTDKELSIRKLGALAKDGFEALYPSASGDDYIASQIANALNVTYVKEEVKGLLGDINQDGKVNNADVNLAYRYVSVDLTLKEFTDIQLKLADVNQDGKVNNADVNVLFRFVSADTTLVWKPVEINI